MQGMWVRLLIKELRFHLPQPERNPQFATREASKLQLGPYTAKLWASLVVQWLKNLPTNAGVASDTSSIPGSGRCSGEGNGNPHQYSCLENSMDRGAIGSQRVRHDRVHTHD